MAEKLVSVKPGSSELILPQPLTDILTKHALPATIVKDYFSHNRKGISFTADPQTAMKLTYALGFLAAYCATDAFGGKTFFDKLSRFELKKLDDRLSDLGTITVTGNKLFWKLEF
ncbi:Uncharacterised protein [Candidatus Bilamarchaeum dharawalense]|uniref:Uncharacterized protein n=1 Tax=Candidatus Bilamarchaeum dharawalense TaxID=2885759 RepID=A0A5E4LME5_9ARCH|nr:Uncharacterised protein [Candidatus Bilamarchaeum dharawalense]